LVIYTDVESRRARLALLFFVIRGELF